jgi:hypothetical protein
VQYIGSDGRLITESFTDYATNHLRNAYPTLETFLLAADTLEDFNARWDIAPLRQAILELAVRTNSSDKMRVMSRRVSC